MTLGIGIGIPFIRIGGGSAPSTGWVGTSGVRTYTQIFTFSETFVY